MAIRGFIEKNARTKKHSERGETAGSIMLVGAVFSIGWIVFWTIRDAIRAEVEERAGYNQEVTVTNGAYKPDEYFKVKVR